MLSFYVRARGYRFADPKQACFAHEAREFLRKKLIGKHVKVVVDFVRPAREGESGGGGGGEVRQCATVRYGGQNVCVGLILVLA
jgi:staphylococcal nuclease domain-containing protein 1